MLKELVFVSAVAIATAVAFVSNPRLVNSLAPDRVYGPTVHRQILELPMGDPPIAVSCDQDGDCRGVCPGDALACACAQTRIGDSMCVPACATDTDCPRRHDDEPVGLRCEIKSGICVPWHAPGVDAPAVAAQPASG